MGVVSHGTLKFTLSQERIDWMNWYFACWCKFRKAKSYCIDFWEGMVRKRCGHLVHETLRSAVSKEWVYEFSWFSACWLWDSNFWLEGYRTLYLWLLNASRLQLCLLDPYSSQKGPMKLGLSMLPSCCLLGCFVGIGSLGFSEFRHSTRKPYEVAQARFFGKTFFAHQNWGNGSKSGQK